MFGVGDRACVWVGGLVCMMLCVFFLFDCMDKNLLDLKKEDSLLKEDLLFSDSSYFVPDGFDSGFRSWELLFASFGWLSDNDTASLEWKQTSDWNSYDQKKYGKECVKDGMKFPVDLVYTWVNSSDENWAKKFEKYFPNGDYAMSKYREWDELRYSIRSVVQHMNWICRIFIVVDDVQVPNWLNLSHPRIVVVKHSQLFENQNELPSFNSFAIESVIHRVPGISDVFVMMNNDIFIGRDTLLSHFISDTHYFRYSLTSTSAWPDECNQLLEYLTSLALAEDYISEDSFFNKRKIPPSSQLHLDEKTLRYNFTNQEVDTISRKCSNLKHFFFTNRLIMKKYFGVDTQDWFLHKPQLLYKPLLETVESILWDELRFTRIHRMRSYEDVFPLLQYEAAIKANILPWRKLLHISFNELSLEEQVATYYAWGGVTEKDYDELHAHVKKYHPRWICLEDGQGNDPNMLHYHQIKMHQFMQDMFPTVAPWEKYWRESGQCCT